MKIVDDIPLLNVMGLLRPSIHSSDRLNMFKIYLYDYWDFPVVKLYYTDFFKLWVDYVSLNKENCREYDKLAKRSVYELGDLLHAEILHKTRFYWQTHYLIRKNKVDVVINKGDYCIKD